MGIFSRRTGCDRTLNPVARAVAEARAAGRALNDLTAANPTDLDLPYPVELLSPLAHPRGLRYRASPLGLPAAREAVAALYRDRGIDVAADQVALTASSSESYGFLFKLLCDPGDRVLAPRPSYPLLDLLAQLDAVRLAPYQLGWDGRWYVDLPTARAAVDARARAVITVHPNNPTGSYLDRDELAALAALGLPIISDEVFAPYPLSGRADRARTALEAAADALVFTLGGLSKRVGLPQLKLGWIVVAGPPALRDEALARLELIGDSYLCAPSPVQQALPELLAAAAPVREALLARAGDNLAALQSAAARCPPLDVLKPDGGWYAIVRLPRVMSDIAWAETLVAQDGVLTHPGAFFGLERGAHLVVSLVAPAERFVAGVDAIVGRASRS